MYAIVLENTYDPTKLAKGQSQLAEFQESHSSQSGYRGTVVVDIGDNRWLTVNLWESEEDARTALPALQPVVQRLLEPLMGAPSQLLGAGPVVLTDVVGQH